MSGQILGKYFANYWVCKNCECIFIDKPFWLNEAYSESIVRTDTGIMVRNINTCNQLMIIFNTYFNPEIKVVDYGGGYGILARMLRDKGVNALWYDKFSQNLLARGFEYDGHSKADAMLAFEVMEHLEDPMETLNEIFEKTDCFIFSTDLLPRLNYKSTNEWWYFAPEAGQHIFFYSEKTLKTIANNFGLEYSKINKLHIFHKKGMFKNKRVIVKVKFFVGRVFIKLLDFFIFESRFKSRMWDDHRDMRSKMNNG
ncbi:class I SAM-dependent methyltransferase [Maribellus comscasis]|nr:class I SAM-dependent methyltransferase [Maribellus comscasis]